MQVAVVLLGAAFPAGSGAFAPRAAFNPAPPQRPGIPSGPGRASLPFAEHGAGVQLQHRRGLRLLRLPRLPRFRTALASSAPRDNATTPAESAAALPDAPRRTVFGVDIRLVVLCLLVVQNACQMMSMRYSRVGAAAAVAGTPYLASTAVVLSEVLKVAACFVILAFTHKGKTLPMLYEQVLVNWQDTLKVSVPAFVYMLQNNLLYVATANLDAATCQITYQLKILTTALFTVTMLGRTISVQKWAALVILVAGIALVQLPSLAAKGATSAAVGNPAVGLAAVVVACFMSGFAGAVLPHRPISG